jgi:tetratricopeptide (TPR) repeat protein/energy-coupling factor transporter ATP-binding protein EcfA2
MSDRPDVAGVEEPFPSVTAIRLAHSELLRRHAATAGSSTLSPVEIDEFVLRARATGALLDNDDDRWVVQGLLDYWVTALLRAGHTIDDATLDEFDPESAPYIPEEECPFVGLDAFQESDASKFFGRNRLVADTVALVERTQMVAVFGQSGSGKSSLLRSGVVPALKGGIVPGSDRWQYMTPIVPGSDPLAALARCVDPRPAPGSGATLAARFLEDAGVLCEALSGDNQPAVLVVDQFEELFTLTDDKRHRQAFVSELLALTDAPTPRHVVLISMRSDYETFVAQIPDLHKRLEGRTLRITPMDATELREAIEGPAAAVGLRFESGVVDALLNDTLGEPAALPLLQFTLWKLWNNRVRNRVTWDAYKKLGGGRLALARSADAFYDALIPQNQTTARRILLRMVRPGDGLEVTSSRVRRSALFERSDDPERVRYILKQLIEQRLIRLSPGETSDDDQVEVAHEALVRNWPLLVEWLEHERQAIATRRRLEGKASDWQRLGGGVGGLLDEAQLYEAERWIQSPAAEKLGYDAAVTSLVRASREALDMVRAEADASRLREVEHAKQLAMVERQRADESEWALSRSRRQTRVVLTLAAAVAFATIVVLILANRANRASLTATLERARAQTAHADAQKAYLEAQGAYEEARAAAAFAKAQESEASIQRDRAIQQEREARIISDRVKMLLAAEETARRDADAARLQAESARTDLVFFQDNLRKAREAYQESLALSQRVVASVSTTNQELRGGAASLSKLGDVAVDNGDLASARAAYQESLAISRRLTASDPANSRSQRDLAMNLANLGDVALAMGDLTSARAAFEESLTIRRQLSTSDPSNRESSSEVGLSVGKIGDVAIVSGDLVSARAAYQESLAISRRLTASDPANSGSQRILAMNLAKLGHVAIMSGDLASARAAYEESLAISRRLTASDPANSESQRDIAMNLRQLGAVAIASGDLVSAQADYLQSLEITKRQASADPSNIDWQRDLAIGYSMIADVLAQQGRLTEALRSLEQALAISLRLASLDSSNAVWKKDVEQIQARVSELKGREPR